VLLVLFICVRLWKDKTMARQKKYIEATKHLTKRVPASQLQKCHEIIDEYLTPFEAPKVDKTETDQPRNTPTNEQG
jgi:3-methyladenine DNA glycosylase Tag